MIQFIPAAKCLFPKHLPSSVLFEKDEALYFCHVQKFTVQLEANKPDKA